MADTFVKVPGPAVLPPTGNVYDCAFSPDGKFMAIGSSNAPFAMIYSLANGVFTNITVDLGATLSAVNACMFSVDSKYMILALGSSPYVAIYSISATGVFTRMANPAVLPGAISQGGAFSKDGKYLAITSYATPFVTIYSISATGVFTKLPDPAVLPTSKGATYGCAFSPDGKYLVIGYYGAPLMTIYSISATGVFTKIENPAVVPPNTGNNGSINYCQFSSDGKYLALAHELAPFITIYSISATGVFTKVADPAVLPSRARVCKFSNDNKYLAITGSNQPPTIYSISSAGVFTKIADPAVLPAGFNYGCGFSVDNMYLVFTGSGEPRITIYSTDNLPIIANLSANITSTHNSSITISFTASDPDNDPLTYQISINGVVYQAYKTYTGAVSLTIPASKFVIGTNSILVSVSDSKLTVIGELFITRTDTAPVLTGTLDKQVFHGVIGDAENDTIRWRGLLNGTVLYNWSSYEASPVSIDFTLTASQVHIGAANVLRMEYEDDLGLAGNAEFDFVGVDYSARKKVLLPFIM